MQFALYLAPKMFGILWIAKKGSFFFTESD
jgi:hypothetical protein